MTDLFVSKTLAELAQKKGFDYPCLMGWNRNDELCSKIAHTIGGNSKISWDSHDSHIPAPLYQQIIDWLLEKHKIHVAVSPFPVYNGKYGTQVCNGSIQSGWEPAFENGNTRKQALDFKLEEVLNGLKDKK